MDLSEPYPKDELDNDELGRLVRRVLKARVSDQAPSDRVWKRIETALEEDKLQSRETRFGWSRLVIQAVLVLPLVLVAGVGIEYSSSP